MNPEGLSQSFPAEIEFPEALRLLCRWHELKSGEWISGHFRLTEGARESVPYWFGTSAVIDRFAVFGTGPDGSLYAIWLEDDGRIPIVHLGSEGQNNMILADTMIDFLRLLAIGYDEIGFADLSQPPDSRHVNKAFQDWVARTFQVVIPRTGVEIVGSAGASHSDFQAWISHVISSTQQMK